MRIFPAIDLKNGRCVRLRQGVKDSETVYSDDPLDVALRWRDEGAAALHLVNLDGAFDGPDAKNLRATERIVSKIGIPVQFGGGVRTIRQAADLIELGAARIILGTVAAERPELVGEMLERFSPARIVIGVDARDGRVLTHGWESDAGRDAVELAREMAALGVERIVYTDVSRDGMLTGPNVAATQRIAEASGLKVIASGGVSSLADIVRLKAAATSGVEGCIVGKALYENRFTLREALAAAEAEATDARPPAD